MFWNQDPLRKVIFHWKFQQSSNLSIFQVWSLWASLPYLTHMTRPTLHNPASSENCDKQQIAHSDKQQTAHSVNNHRNNQFCVHASLHTGSITVSAGFCFTQSVPTSSTATRFVASGWVDSVGCSLRQNYSTNPWEITRDMCRCVQYILIQQTLGHSRSQEELVMFAWSGFLGQQMCMGPCQPAAAHSL